ncbi:DUF5689 domain-containing protein [Mariniflexile gromovii]|uniref:Choice-of-anchor J domain-containing protein n=1 Tax=Mariniflexile gromovii TaxID=362523 RepID=A0ABS4BQ49_9FLAO|nr:DUF5689 domain-containing protein [Mariniflexile gromovii]MBP0902709.1 choice-of-anchor J domain-containing protein [Mariniflexile gromovii]
MKNINKILMLMVAVVASFTIQSCVQDDDFTVPTSLGNDENEGLKKLLAKIDNGQVQLQTIAQVKSNFVQYEATQITSEIAVKGYVSSSDETGNFYKEFFIQDSPTNPTSTLKVVLNQVDTYNQFNKGREVYIYLKGLYIGETNTGDDVITIGGKFDTFDNDVLAMTANQIPDHLFRSTTTETLVPKELSLSQITEAHIGMFVKLLDVQFPIGLAGQPYIDPTDDFDSQRPIESCSDSSEFILESSTFASFKNIILPTNGKGTISGIINKTYDGYDLVINLNSTDDVVMDGNRCDPLFVETFETNFTTWTAYSVTGAQVWQSNNYGNPGKCAAMSGYASGNKANEDWLITPAIDLSNVTGAILTFQTAKNFTGNVLEVYMSTNYVPGSNPTTSGTWSPISATLSSGSWTWTDSGNIDVSAAAGGNLFVAFKYTSTTSASATYEVDNVKVVAK